MLWIVTALEDHGHRWFGMTNMKLRGWMKRAQNRKARLTFFCSVINASSLFCIVFFRDSISSGCPGHHRPSHGCRVLMPLFKSLLTYCRFLHLHVWMLYAICGIDLNNQIIVDMIVITKQHHHLLVHLKIVKYYYQIHIITYTSLLLARRDTGRADAIRSTSEMKKRIEKWKRATEKKQL